ncbi:hypothetical protein VDGE_30427 [Verticillium dahliae]|uniref:Uncharacterized protein n=1 Tax=Verticillium dahliae TaxID=27337 RepID=A0A444RK00_VERDA|nr:hypothetical protein VDGE_30427 [Verticillium dahliae]
MRLGAGTAATKPADRSHDHDAKRVPNPVQPDLESTKLPRKHLKKYTAAAAATPHDGTISISSDESSATSAMNSAEVVAPNPKVLTGSGQRSPNKRAAIAIASMGGQNKRMKRNQDSIPTPGMVDDSGATNIKVLAEDGDHSPVGAAFIKQTTEIGTGHDRCTGSLKLSWTNWGLKGQASPM